ncbi:hypothetical protein [Paraburkholderia sacchari]|uniref:hypothetical protein n=1 Tax=Paraburkholderia sacchari TaxID=159450 RepID=UPI001BD0CF35|nr:hypothetical protein [Paraburkholderia sacchari]
MIQCKLFTTHLWPVDSAYDESDEVAIVMADINKVDAAMKCTLRYYVNELKIRLHTDYLEKGIFEAPLVHVRAGSIEWVEGYHQVSAAKNAGLEVIPVSTAKRMVSELKQLVGIDDPQRAAEKFNFMECSGVPVYY